MESNFIIGNYYSLNEIHEKGFINTKVTSIYLFFKKANTFMTFNIPNLFEERKYKLINIINN